MIVCLDHNGMFYTLSDCVGYVRGRVMEERFGGLSTWSWSYMEPNGPFLSKIVGRGSAECFDDALRFILDRSPLGADRLESGTKSCF